MVQSTQLSSANLSCLTCSCDCPVVSSCTALLQLLFVPTLGIIILTLFLLEDYCYSFQAKGPKGASSRFQLWRTGWSAFCADALEEPEEIPSIPVNGKGKSGGKYRSFWRRNDKQLKADKDRDRDSKQLGLVPSDSRAPTMPTGPVRLNLVDEVIQARFMWIF